MVILYRRFYSHWRLSYLFLFAVLSTFLLLHPTTSPQLLVPIIEVNIHNSSKVFFVPKPKNVPSNSESKLLLTSKDIINGVQFVFINKTSTSNYSKSEHESRQSEQQRFTRVLKKVLEASEISENNKQINFNQLKGSGVLVSYTNKTYRFPASLKRKDPSKWTQREQVWKNM